MAAYGAWNIRLQRQTVEASLQNTAAALSLAVDRELSGIRSLLLTLANSPAVQDHDLPALYARAQELARAHDGWIVLTDASGQQLINTLLPFGHPLPRTASPETIAEVFETGETVVSNLFFGRAAGRQVISLLVPVVRRGEIVSTLDMTFTPERLSKLLESNKLPAGWVSKIIDRQGVFLARSSDWQEYVGQPAPSWFVGQGDAKTISVAEGEARDGTPVEAAFARSGLSGWTTVVMEPAELLRAPVARATAVVAAGGFASLVFATVAAWYIGRRITLPLQSLARNADGIVSGRIASTGDASISEVAEVQRSLLKAAANQREKVEAQIQLQWERRARRAAEEAHQEILRRDMRFRRLIDANLIGIVVATEVELVEANDAFLKMIGYTRDDINEVKDRWCALTPPEFHSIDAQAIREILEKNESEPYEKAFFHKTGRLVHVLIGCAKVEAADLAWICYVVDLTRQKQAEADLRVTEERYRVLTEAIASIVWTTAPDGTVVDIPKWRAATGQTVEQSAGWGWLDAVHPDDRLRALQAWQTAVADISLYNTEYRIRDAEGNYGWYNARGLPVMNADRSVREWVGVCIDISDRKAAEERQALLMAELDHRVRNILASIQAMISLTSQGSPSKEEYVKRLHGRIAAMARTHGLLTRQKWSGASLQRLIEDELIPYGQRPESVTIQGEPAHFILRPRVALNLSLVLHELATNAAKYGALSAPAGRVNISWRVERKGGEPHLLLQWCERDGPAVSKPTRVGFGSTLIKSALAGEPEASVTLDFDPGGVQCRIELPLAQKRADAGLSPAGGVHGHDDHARQGLGRRRVLVAEDEPLVSLEIAAILTSAGVEVVGPAATAEELLAMIAGPIVDVAVLDTRLKGVAIFPAADKLSERGVPVVFLTDAEGEPLPERYQRVPVVHKPVEAGALVTKIKALLSASSSGDSQQRQAHPAPPEAEPAPADSVLARTC
jgi:PAS domain S-box-containing protein